MASPCQGITKALGQSTHFGQGPGSFGQLRCSERWDLWPPSAVRTLNGIQLSSVSACYMHDAIHCLSHVDTHVELGPLGDADSWRRPCKKLRSTHCSFPQSIQERLRPEHFRAETFVLDFGRGHCRPMSQMILGRSFKDSLAEHHATSASIGAFFCTKDHESTTIGCYTDYSPHAEQ